jgi:uncharacterized protein (DUF983 family)
LTAPRNRYWTILGRALRLRCPRCGRGKLFSGWFRMFPECDWCGIVYDREPGFFLGSVYVNYGLTALVSTVMYIALLAAGAASPEALLGWMVGFSVLFPLWFFRYARSLWLALDQYWDPRDSGDTNQNAADWD